MNRRIPVESILLAHWWSGDDIGRAAAESASAAKTLSLSGRRRRLRGSRLGIGSCSRCCGPQLARPLGSSRPNAYAAARLQVQTLDRAVLRFGIHGVVISRIDLDVEAVSPPTRNQSELVIPA